MSRGRKNIMLGTAGHVDHGKSALVKLLTGCETDTLAEEKKRGLTIDLGFAPCRLADDRIVGVVDVPGHVDFIRNMVAGAHGIDVVILVVAADDGIMPQTYEHLHILTLMGLRHGLVALTKTDLVDAARREEVQAGLRTLLAGTFLSEMPICPISNLTGEGYESFFKTLNRVVNACADRSCGGVFRLWVEDVFTVRGSGTIITGIPSAGMVRVGDTVELLPKRQTGRVRRLQVYGEEANEARAGECVALNVPEFEHAQVQRGMVLVTPGMLSPVTMAEAEMQVIPGLREPLPDYLEAHLHIGTASVMTRVAMLDTTQTAPGERQMVQLRLAEELAMAPGDRFVLRANVAGAGASGLTTVAGGRVLGISNVRLRRHKPWTLSLLTARRDALDSAVLWIETQLRENQDPLEPAELQRRCLLREEEAAALIETLRREGKALATTSGKLVHRERRDWAASRLLALVEEFHQSQPQHAGIDRHQLQAGLGGNGELFDCALASLLQVGALRCSGTVLARADWRAQVTGPEERWSREITEHFQRSGWRAPTCAEVAQALAITGEQVEKSIRLLQERGVLVKLDAQWSMHRDAIQEAQQVALRLLRRAPSFSTMEFRDALGVSRKHAVPLLDYLDRCRFTVRNGNQRTPGVEARKLLVSPPVTTDAHTP